MGKEANLKAMTTPSVEIGTHGLASIWVPPAAVLGTPAKEVVEEKAMVLRKEATVREAMDRQVATHLGDRRTRRKIGATIGEARRCHQRLDRTLG